MTVDIPLLIVVRFPAWPAICHIHAPPKVLLAFPFGSPPDQFVNVRDAPLTHLQSPPVAEPLFNRKPIHRPLAPLNVS